MGRQGDETPDAARRPRNPDWSADEVRLVVADYFAMLGPDLLGGKCSKTRHRDLLRPYIRGYKPRGHFQASLVDAVDQYLC